jgi:hypothetical protein
MVKFTSFLDKTFVSIAFGEKLQSFLNYFVYNIDYIFSYSVINSEDTVLLRAVESYRECNNLFCHVT